MKDIDLDEVVSDLKCCMHPEDCANCSHWNADDCFEQLMSDTLVCIEALKTAVNRAYDLPDDGSSFIIV